MPSKKHAIVVLPPAGRGGELPPFPPPRHRWLARSRVSNARGEILSQVLSVLALPTPTEGFGALRLWGQTGAPPDGWVAAADPVFFEARLNHVALHRLDEAEVDAAEVASLFAHLQEHLAENGAGFSSIGKLGYVHRRHPMEVARASPAVAEGNFPEDFLPTGDRSQTHDRLQSEVQMCLFESVVNQRRAMAGKPPISGLWMWGGGVVPSLPKAPLPPLFADEPLCRGYWLASSAAVADWAGDLEACLAHSPDGFVAVLPASAAADHDDGIDAHLESLHRMLRRGRLRAVTLLPGRGLRVDTGRWDALRLWRRKLTLPGEEHGG